MFLEFIKNIFSKKVQKQPPRKRFTKEQIKKAIDEKNERECIEKKTQKDSKHLNNKEVQAMKAALKKDDNGNYIFDKTKAGGSIENPIIVGIPEYSNVLVYDSSKDRWILTDSLGNGWIR